jgi:hypothetical protein
MVASVMPITLANRLEAPHSPNRMFDDDPKMTEYPIVDDVLKGTRFAAWFTPGRKALRSQFRQLEIGQITANTDLSGHLVQQPTVLQQLDVRCRAAHPLRN